MSEPAMTGSLGNKVKNVRTIGKKVKDAVLGFFKVTTDVSGEAKKRSPAKLFNRNADKAKSKFSAGQLFGLTRISGNEASREGAAHWMSRARMIFSRGLAYNNPPKFKCIACSLRKKPIDRTFHTRLKLEEHCREKAKHETDNNSHKVHHKDCFCKYCGNGFKDDDDRDAHQAICEHAP